MTDHLILSEEALASDSPPPALDEWVASQVAEFHAAMDRA